MRLLNQKTRTAYYTRTTVDRHGKFVSVVVRQEMDEHGTPVREMVSSRELHRTRSRAYSYACSMSRYLFSAHVACWGV